MHQRQKNDVSGACLRTSITPRSSGSMVRRDGWSLADDNDYGAKEEYGEDTSHVEGSIAVSSSRGAGVTDRGDRRSLDLAAAAADSLKSRVEMRGERRRTPRHGVPEGDLLRFPSG